jgi:tetratricopeptide (TPR) repeat protein
MSKRVVETLVDAGKPNDAAATVQLLLDTGGPWALAERVELALIQSRALASSGLMHEALAVLQKAQSDSNNGGSDDDVAQLKPFVQAELGSFLIEIGRPAEALAILSDALKLSNQSTSGRRLRAVIGVNLARGFSQVGDQKRARETARDVLLDDDGRLLEGYPDLQASARLLADGE